MHCTIRLQFLFNFNVTTSGPRVQFNNVGCYHHHQPQCTIIIGFVMISVTPRVHRTTAPMKPKIGIYLLINCSIRPHRWDEMIHTDRCAHVNLGFQENHTLEKTTQTTTPWKRCQWPEIILFSGLRVYLIQIVCLSCIRLSSTFCLTFQQAYYLSF